MFRVLDGSYDNMPKLIAQHGEFCSDLMTDPEPRFNYWLERAEQRYGTSE